MNSTITEQVTRGGSERMSSRRLITEVGATVILIGGVLAATKVMSYLKLSLENSIPLATNGLSMWGYMAVTLGIILCVRVFEQLAPIGPNKDIATWFVNLRINIVYIFTATMVGMFIVAPMLSALSKHVTSGLVDLTFLSHYGVWGLIATFVLSLVVFDFFFYWYHRTMHKFPFLWQIHKVHHIDPRMDALSNSRENLCDALVAAFLISLPSAVFFNLNSYSVGTLGLAIGFFPVVWPIVYHSNVRIQLGRASVLLNCPQVHRIHHSRLPEHQDRNFCAFLPLMDVLFGTYTPPVRNEYAPTGVIGEEDVQSVGDAILRTARGWKQLFLKSRAASGEAV
jgi:sterol desaturase/sphingolipid hydroxylase (fatty acid hydroxylase superfamily)